MFFINGFNLQIHFNCLVSTHFEISNQHLLMLYIQNLPYSIHFLCVYNVIGWNFPSEQILGFYYFFFDLKNLSHFFVNPRNLFKIVRFQKSLTFSQSIVELCSFS